MPGPPPSPLHEMLPVHSENVAIFQSQQNARHPPMLFLCVASRRKLGGGPGRKAKMSRVGGSGSKAKMSRGKLGGGLGTRLR